jgi:Predicted dehydrogenases and related proteins
MNKVKIGVFGAARGRTMINLLADNPYAQLVAICDKYVPLLDSCREAMNEKGIKVELFTTFDEFFQCDMDAVVMANYADEHVPFAIRLMESGRHIVSEVLTCSSLAEGIQLIETVERTGKIYSYAENYCYFNTTYEMRNRYKNGDIGELVHAEGEYIHDCSSIWPQITYGERNHWRNRMQSTFYCTHSLGPIIFATGLRPVSVTGFESPNYPFLKNLGTQAGTHGVEFVTLENGATVKSIHGHLKREPGSINYQMYGTKGCMETDRWNSGNLHVYLESDRNCVGEHTSYKPEFVIKGAEQSGHGGSDFFTMHYFIQQILGDSDAKVNCIDVYTAVDMCIPGILSYKSILDGGKPYAVPNFRNLTEREPFRNDTFTSSKPIPQSDIPDEIYETVRQKWLNGEQG